MVESIFYEYGNRMPRKPILFYSHKCGKSVELVKNLKKTGTIHSIICVNVSKPYRYKIPPQIRSVPSIMNTQG